VVRGVADDRFDDDHEWWVSGRVFERLFRFALAHVHLELSLEDRRHVTDANGGSSWADIEPAIARDLKAGPRTHRSLRRHDPVILAHSRPGDLASSRAHYVCLNAITSLTVRAA
jgi:hypothetical protein